MNLLDFRFHEKLILLIVHYFIYYKIRLTHDSPPVLRAREEMQLMGH
jgi:hypothetical protein